MVLGKAGEPVKTGHAHLKAGRQRIPMDGHAHLKAGGQRIPMDGCCGLFQQAFFPGRKCRMSQLNPSKEQYYIIGAASTLG